MNLNVVVNKKKVTLTPNEYKTAGGQAALYVKSGLAYKVYHDPKKMMPIGKIAELQAINHPSVNAPKDVIYDDKTGQPVGVTLDFITDAFALALFFTRTFKDDRHIDHGMVNAAVKDIQLITKAVHGAKCLVVDLNELNVLVKILTAGSLSPAFIDTDSYGTPSYPAMAIMDSVRDRRVSKAHVPVWAKHGQDQMICKVCKRVVANHDAHPKIKHLDGYHPDVLSDWFSFAVIAFWTYTNIHPFRGTHPSYPAKEKVLQMDDGVSVFHSGVRVPPSVNNFNVIPQRHLEWFKAVFLKGERSEPPLPDGTAPVSVPTAVVVLKGTDKLEIIQVSAFPEAIAQVFEVRGEHYAVGQTRIFDNKANAIIQTGKARKVVLVGANDGTVVAGIQLGNRVRFVDQTGRDLGMAISSHDIFARNQAIYTGSSGQLVQNTFTVLGSRLLHRPQPVDNISELTATFYEGCAFQDLLGKKWITIPYAADASRSIYLPQLDKMRVVSVKCERNVAVVLAEQGGIYHRFVYLFKTGFREFDVRETHDVAFDAINFTVMPNGLCVLLANPDEVELFTSNPNQFETLSNPPFDSTMRLFSNSSGVFILNGSTIHQVKRK